MKRLKLFCLFIVIFAYAFSAFAINGRTTYQAKIVKPDGYPLEAANVNFRFTVLDLVGTCSLYVENYSAVNMTNTGGLISFALGNGTRTFPTSGTSQTFQSIFDNSVTSLPCETAGVYTPGVSDTRKIVMQFNDGNGWQTLPAMLINSVPYAMYSSEANIAKTLNNKADTDFVEYAALASLSCQSNEAIQFNGVSFGCIAAGVSSSGLSSVTTSGSVLLLSGTVSAPVIGIQAASISQDGYLSASHWATFNNKQTATSAAIIATLGYTPADSATLGTLASANSIDLGSASATGVIAEARFANQTGVISGTQYTKVTVDGKGFVTNGSSLSLGDVTTALGYTPASATASTQWNTSGTTINYTNGKVGIGTSAPSALLEVKNASATVKVSSTDGISATYLMTNMNGIFKSFFGTEGLAGTTFTDSLAYATIVGSESNVPVQIATNDSVQVTVLSNGNVGIGTTAPNQKLVVGDDIGVISANNAVVIGASGTVNTQFFMGNDTNNFGNMIWDSTNRDLIFRVKNAGTLNANQLVMDSSGSVGIGTNTPIYALDVSGAVRASSFILQAPPGDPAPVIATRAVPAGQGAANEKSELILFHSNDPTNGAGPDQITLRAPALSFQTYSNAAVADINDNNGYNERMYISPTGDVGVGTASPTAKLDVRGQVKTSMGTPLVNPAGNAVDFSSGNTQYVTFSTCPGNALTVNLFSMFEGSSYSIVVVAPSGCLVDFTGTTHANGGSGGVFVTGFKYPAGQKFSSTGNPMVYSFLRANNIAFVAQVVDFQ